MKIAFVGTPSCGKTTLAKDIVKLTKGIYIPEAARLYFSVFQHKEIEGQQYKIAQLQSNLEKTLEKSNELNICEVPVYLSAIYDHLYNNQKHVDDILELSMKHKYDKVFHLVDTPHYEEDGIRYHTKDELFKLDYLINRYSEGQNIVPIFGIEKSKRISKVLEEIL